MSQCVRSIGWKKDKNEKTFLGHKCIAISCHIKCNIESNARIFLAQFCPFSKRTLLLRNEIIYVCGNWNKLHKWHKPNACINKQMTGQMKMTTHIILPSLALALIMGNCKANKQKIWWISSLTWSHTRLVSIIVCLPARSFTHSIAHARTHSPKTDIVM